MRVASDYCMSSSCAFDNIIKAAIDSGIVVALHALNRPN